MGERGLIGIVSGLGPLAGSDVLDQALAYAAGSYGATEDAEYPDIVLFSHGIESFDSTGSMDDTFLRELVAVVQEIELHHPTVLGIACNTAHLHLDTVLAHTEARFVNLIEETAAAAAALEHRYLLLSSSITRETGLYHDALDRRNVDYVDVSGAEQLEIDRVVHLVMAHELETAGAAITRFVHHLRSPSSDGPSFDGIIAACTELPIAFDHSAIGNQVPIVSSNQVLAYALVDTYYRMQLMGRVRASEWPMATEPMRVTASSR